MMLGVPVTRMTSGASATSSAAYFRARSASPPALLNADRPALAPAAFLQALRERSTAGLFFWVVGGQGHEYANPPFAISLLRARRERPSSGSAAERDQQLPPSDGVCHHTPPARGA